MKLYAPGICFTIMWDRGRSRPKYKENKTGHELLLFKTSDKLVGGTDTMLLLCMFKTLHNKKLKGICRVHVIQSHLQYINC